jgi:Immunity protein Imm1
MKLPPQQNLLCYFSPFEGELQELPENIEILIDRLEGLRARYTPMVGCPFTVDVVKDDGGLESEEYRARLSVGLGDGEWIVIYNPGLDKGLWLYSLGDETATGFAPFFFGQWSELSRKYLVPKETALEAVRIWYEDGRLTDAVAWTSKIHPAGEENCKDGPRR